MTRVVAIAAIATALSINSARADAPKLAGIAAVSPSDARKAIAIGPDGEVYEPDGKGAWLRTHAGGTADELVGFTTTATGTVIADAKGPALFRLRPNGWTSIKLSQKAKSILGAGGLGSRIVAAAGKGVFALDKGIEPVKLADAPLPVLALAAGPANVIISTPKGLLALQGTTFKPIKNAPKSGGTLLSDRWLLVSGGAFDLKTLKMSAWPAGTRITDTYVIGADTLLAVGQRGKTTELYTVKPGKPVDRDEVPLPNASPVVGVVGDKAGRVVIATKDGHLAIRAKAPAKKPATAPASRGKTGAGLAGAKAAAAKKGASAGDDATATASDWTIVEVQDALPAARPGPGPAQTP